MLTVIENLHAEVRQVEMPDIHAALVPVEQPDPTVVGDPQIRWSRITVNHRCRHVRHRCEHGEHLAGGVIGESRHVGVDTARQPIEFGDHLTARSLPMGCEASMEALQFGATSSQSSRDVGSEPWIHCWTTTPSADGRPSSVSTGIGTKNPSAWSAVSSSSSQASDSANRRLRRIATRPVGAEPVHTSLRCPPST